MPINALTNLVPGGLGLSAQLVYQAYRLNSTRDTLTNTVQPIMAALQRLQQVNTVSAVISSVPVVGGILRTAGGLSLGGLKNLSLPIRWLFRNKKAYIDTSTRDYELLSIYKELYSSVFSGLSLFIKLLALFKTYCLIVSTVNFLYMNCWQRLPIEQFVFSFSITDKRIAFQLPLVPLKEAVKFRIYFNKYTVLAILFGAVCLYYGTGLVLAVGYFSLRGCGYQESLAFIQGPVLREFILSKVSAELPDSIPLSPRPKASPVSPVGNFGTPTGDANIAATLNFDEVAITNPMLHSVATAYRQAIRRRSI